jgi:hypothetical protein
LIYDYRLTSVKAIDQVQNELLIEAVLENPDTWSKTYTLVAPVTKKGDVNVTFPLDLTQFVTIFDTIQKETGISAANRFLTIKATLHTQAQTDQGPINKIFTQSIKTDLREGILTFSGELKKSTPGSIDLAQNVQQTKKLLKLPVIWCRLIFSLAAALLLAGLLLYIRQTRRSRNPLKEQGASQIVEKYKDIVVDVQEWPDSITGQTVLTVDSAQTLLKAGQGLLKPVNHASRDGEHVYWVNDDSVRYEFRVTKKPS